jgi:gamma-glutamyl phosphate reductase
MNEPSPKGSPFPEQSLLDLMRGIGQAARSAALVLALAPSDRKNRALRAAAAALRTQRL